MGLTKYLRIKQSGVLEDMGGLPGIYNVCTYDDGTVDPDLLTTFLSHIAKSIPEDRFYNNIDVRFRKDPATGAVVDTGLDNINKFLRRRNLYRNLVANTNLISGAETIPTNGDTESVLRAYRDTNGKIVHTDNPMDRYVLVRPDALMSDIFHEHGHQYNRNVAGIDYISGPEAKETAKNWGKYKIYDPAALRSVLADERAATDYAKRVVSTIKDPVLRWSLSNEINDNLENAYETYNLKYGNPLRAHNFGKGVATVLGGAGIGYLGYRGGDALAKYFKLKNNGWGHNLLRYGGMLAGGAGGAYLSNKYLGDRFGDVGQLAYQVYNNATGHETNARKLLEEKVDAAKKRYAGNVDSLERYINSQTK